MNNLELYNNAKSAYYIGEPIMSDLEFDTLENSLIAQNLLTKYVGISESSYGKDIKHINPVLSLAKINETSDIIIDDHAMQLIEKFPHGIILSWKYDGLAMNIKYVDGILESIASRNNGLVGKDRTQKLKHLVPQTIDYDGTIEVRGEILMSNDVFIEKYMDDYTHPRNCAAGIVNDINVNCSKKLDIEFIAFEAITENGKVIFDETLRHFNIKENKIILNIEQLKEGYTDFYYNRKTFSYPTDGLVASDIRNNIDFVHNDHDPKHAVAIKFPAPEKISRIVDIEWKLTKTGKYVPNIKFEAVEIDGRSIKQATGHNMSWMLKNNMTIGKKVVITMKGDIIPQCKPYLNE